jgi:hypothetical protein
MSYCSMVCFCGNVFNDPLPSNGQGAAHIENTSYDTLLLCALILGVA